MVLDFPWMLWLNVPLGLLVIYYFWFKVWQKPARIIWPAAGLLGLNILSPKLLSLLRMSLFAIRIIAISLLLYSASKPYSSYRDYPTDRYGNDIVVTLDISNSMNQEDIQPSRIFAAKTMLKEFIENRTGDRIGMVVFGAESYVQAPQTSDFKALQEILDQIYIGNGELNARTAIGDALTVAASRILKSPAKNRIILLFTDGNDTASDKTRPETALEAIKKLKIKIYTVAIGRSHASDPVNFSLLESMAKQTGGKFYRAENLNDLYLMMMDFNSLEKTIINQDFEVYKVPENGAYILLAFFMILVSFILEIFFLRQKPA